MKNGNNKRVKNEVENPTEKILEMIRTEKNAGLMTDPNGSYTGTPENKKDKPVQDADDL